MDQSWLSLIPFAIACAAAAFSGGAFPPGHWYRRLDLPSWTPPDWAFPVIWTTLYVLIAWAGWRVGLRAPMGEAALPLGLWACQIALNTLWTPVFFGLRNPHGARIVIGGLWVAVLAAMLSLWALDTVAGLLFLPYLVWVSYAAALNFWIAAHNPRDAASAA